MTVLKFEITGADVTEFPNEITRPDYPIMFEVVENFEKSVDAIAQEKGCMEWFKMHGEVVEHVYYSVERKD